jgi:PadR family transcriptional regulator, regulatory protein PadR
VTDTPDSTGKWEVQLRKGCIELAVLASLWDGRLYGLEMLRRLEYFSGLPISEGTLYPLLSRLNTAGWVISEWQDAPLGHPRRYYTLTPRGRNRVEEMSRVWSGLTRNIDQLLARFGNRQTAG